MISIQPNPSFFYQAFLELDCATVVSILAFDTQSMESLLNEKNNQYFSDEYPIIYKNKISKDKSSTHYFYRTAIDVALRNNQIGALNAVLDYIVKY